MSNVIINKDRWQPKPKYQKVKSYHSKKFHSEKEGLIKEGYTEEEISKIFHKESLKNEKKQLLKRELEVSIYIKFKLDMLNIEQHNRLLKTIIKDFKTSKIMIIKKHIDKLAISVSESKEGFKSELLNKKSKKDYKKKEFQSVKDLRNGYLKIVKNSKN